MEDVGLTLAGVFAATEAQHKSKQIRNTPAPIPEGKAEVTLFIQKWDDAVRAMVASGKVKSEEDLKQITLYDFMTWLRGQGV
jgi:hypothetical protein